MGRGRKYGVQKYLIASGEKLDWELAYQLSLKSDNYYATIGVHPCFTREVFEGKTNKNHEEMLNEYFEAMRQAIANRISSNKIVAVGECGLDYDRFHFSSKEVQHKVFLKHFDLAEEFNLPMYFHDRSTAGAFTKIVK